jgi:transketolase
VRWKMTYLQWMKENPELAEQFECIERGELPRSLPWPQFTPENGAVATRDSGGATMNAIAASLPELVGGSADLDPSTKTYLKGQGDFEPNNYAGRNIHNGVREHAMAAVNNGIAYHGGLLPFSATFFNFVDYLKPALRLTALAHIHHIYVFTHDSVFLGEDGPTHEPIEQLAMLRAIPNLNTIRPADAIEVVEAWKLVIEPKSGPWVLVLTRVPFLGARSAPVEKGAYVIADANGLPDLVLIATGSEVSLALEAKKLLDAQGIDARVVSMPLDALCQATGVVSRRGPTARSKLRACPSKPPQPSAGLVGSATRALPSGSIVSACPLARPISQRPLGSHPRQSPNSHEIRSLSPLTSSIRE